MHVQEDERRGLSLYDLRMVAIGCLAVLSLSACQTPQQQVADKEDNLLAAGFLAQPASTPARQAMLHRLPANHFVQRSHGDTISYVYADPLVCNCLYVGAQDAYGRYKLHMQQQRLADEQQLTAQMYSDPGWNWGAWGGGYGPGFAYGPGFGW